ncbi:MAG: energy transducer TonB [Candidatus Eremiobacteraeota bacterium]|nr:energy transducer TonB [Candidatus Eremiobacteraeota bacterium]
MAVYPAAARDLGMQGIVTVAVRVDSRGDLKSAHILKSSGHPILDDAALRAAVASTYRATASGKLYKIEYSFSLQ